MVVGPLPGSQSERKRGQDTVPQALTCALEANDFEDAIRNAISLGGDSDTIAAIAGSVAEARFGIDEDMVGKAWSYLPGEMRAVLRAPYAAAGEAGRTTHEDIELLESAP